MEDMSKERAEWRKQTQISGKVIAAKEREDRVETAGKGYRRDRAAICGGPS
jgi:hypothetical protein